MAGKRTDYNHNMNGNEKRAVILIGHGSRAAGADDDMERIAGRLRAAADGGIVDLCRMAHGTSFGEAFERCVRQGAKTVIVIPYFLFLMIWRNFFPAGMFWAALSAGSLSLIISIELLQRARQRIATLSEISVSGDNHRLRGAKPPFLDRLPLFPRK